MAQFIDAEILLSQLAEDEARYFGTPVVVCSGVLGTRRPRSDGAMMRTVTLTDSGHRAALICTLDRLRRNGNGIGIS